MLEKLPVGSILRRFLNAFSVAAMIVFMAGCKNASLPIPPPNSPANHALTPATEAAIVAFCSDCHAMPDPASFPKNAWDKEVRRGYDFYYASGRNNLTVPVFADTKHYFVARAPEALTLLEPGEVDSDWLNRFQRSPIAIEGLTKCAVSFVDVEIGRAHV